MGRGQNEGTIYKVKDKSKRRKPWRAVSPLSMGREHVGYFKTKALAQEALDAYFANPKIIVDAPTLQQLFDRLLYNKRHKSENTQKMYKNSWIYFEGLKDEKITDVRAIHLQDQIDYMVDELELGYSTCQKFKSTASQLYDIAIKNDYVDRNYAKGLIVPDKPTPDNRVFSEIEIKKLKDKAKTSDFAKMIIIMIYTLLRPNELLNLTRFNIHENHIIGGGKTEAGKDRYIPLHETIKPYVKHFLNQNKGSEYLFIYDGKKMNYRYFLDRYYETLEEADVQKLTPHKCRKTGTTRYLKAGMDVVMLQRMLGHTSPDTTVKYYVGDLHDALNKIIEVVD